MPVPAGTTADTELSVRPLKLSAATPPKVTAVGLPRKVPWMITVVPPASGPELGRTAFTDAGATMNVLVITGGATYGGAFGTAGEPATTPAGYPATAALIMLDPTVMLAFVSNSLCVQLTVVPPAPAVRVTVALGSVSVEPAGIFVAPVDTSRYGNGVLPRKVVEVPPTVGSPAAPF